MRFAAFLSAFLLLGTVALLLLGLPVTNARANPPANPPPLDLVFLLDNSASMRQGQQRNLVRGAVRAFVEGLPKTTRIAVLGFDQKVSHQIGFTPVGGDDGERIQYRVGRLPYNGRWTDMGAGLEEALFLLKEQARPEASKAILLFSDGRLDVGDRLRNLQRTLWVREDLTRAASMEKVRVFGIAFSDQADFQLLQILALRTGGDYFRAFQPEALPRLFQSVRDNLAQQERLTASLSAPPAAPSPLTDALRSELEIATLEEPAPPAPVAMPWRMDPRPSPEPETSFVSPPAPVMAQAPTPVAPVERKPIPLRAQDPDNTGIQPVLPMAPHSDASLTAAVLPGSPEHTSHPAETPAQSVPAASPAMSPSPTTVLTEEPKPASPAMSPSPTTVLTEEPKPASPTLPPSAAAVLTEPEPASPTPTFTTRKPPAVPTPETTQGQIKPTEVLPSLATTPKPPSATPSETFAQPMRDQIAPFLAGFDSVGSRLLISLGGVLITSILAILLYLLIRQRKREESLMEAAAQENQQLSLSDQPPLGDETEISLQKSDVGVSIDPEGTLVATTDALPTLPQTKRNREEDDDWFSSTPAQAALLDLEAVTGQDMVSLEGRSVIISRYPSDSDIQHLVLNQPTISRQHSMIEYKENAYWLRDLKSTNGTFVNGRRLTVTERIKLAHGDQLRFHRFDFEFLLKDEVTE